jgi:diguanylate cyclase (GGDEF)-like protein/PAS domain S-box-containing protein
MFVHELSLLDAQPGDGWDVRLTLLDRLQNLVILVKRQQICFVNGEGLRWLGYPDITALSALPLEELFHHDYGELVALGMELLAEERMIPLKILRRDGGVIEVEMWVNQVGPAGENVFLIEAKDITEHLRAARALRSREQWLEGIIKSVADGIITVDHGGIIQSFNPAAERIFRFRATEVIGKGIETLIPEAIEEPINLQDSGLEWQRIMKGGGEQVGKRKDGAVFPIEIAFREMMLGESVTYAGVVRDITDRRRAEERILYMANHDHLTGLANRSLLLDRMEDAINRACRHQRKMAVVFLDLNQFKPINDTYGHAVGDRILIGVGDRLRNALRKTDTVARVGGDEFVLILEEIADEDMLRRAVAKILAAVRAPQEIDGVFHAVASSLGVAQYPGNAEDAATLLELADKAMYRAKQAGDNVVCIFPDMVWQEADGQESAA